MPNGDNSDDKQSAPPATYRDNKGEVSAGNKDVSDENKPMKQRRERRTEAVEKNNNSLSNNDAMTSEGDKPRRKRQTGGLSENDNGGGWMISGPDQPTSNQPVDEDVQKDIANPNNKDKFFQETNNEIVVIPDLDEDGYDVDERVARAPRNVNRAIPSMNELEAEVKAAIPSDEGGLDLGVLLRTLMPASEVQEPDSLWTFESLLRDVTEELTAPAATIISPMSGGLTSNKLNPANSNDGPFEGGSEGQHGKSSGNKGSRGHGSKGPGMDTGGGNEAAPKRKH